MNGRIQRHRSRSRRNIRDRIRIVQSTLRSSTDRELRNGNIASTNELESREDRNNIEQLEQPHDYTEVISREERNINVGGESKLLLLNENELRKRERSILYELKVYEVKCLRTAKSGGVLEIYLVYCTARHSPLY